MVAMKERMQAVVTANKSRQSRARELNVRAGSNMFPVLGQGEIEAWLTERLGNAVSLGSVCDPDMLQMPNLDEELAALVVRENPDEINFLGQAFKVTHRNGYAPSISLEGDAVKEPIWRQLPNEGVLLPSGRAVNVSVKVGYWDSVSESNILQLKQKVREHLNAQQWSAWTKPEIAVPDITAETTVLPNIITSQYGSCVVEGTPLTAYGTLIVNSSRYYQNEPYFKTGWYLNQEEATKLHEASVAKLTEIRKESRERLELESTTKVAESLKTRLESLCVSLESDNSEAIRAIRERRYGYLPSSTPELKVWIAQTEAIIAKAEAVKKMPKFGGHFRVMGSSGNSQYWVIRQDGTQREPDEVSYRKRYTSEGEKYWRLVENELAISWSKSCTAAAHELKVDQLPVGGLSPGQLATVAILEKEIEASWAGRTGMSGGRCPSIGLGWNLKSVPKKLAAQQEPAEKGEVVDLSTMTTLFGVQVQHRKK